MQIQRTTSEFQIEKLILLSAAIFCLWQSCTVFGALRSNVDQIDSFKFLLRESVRFVVIPKTLRAIDFKIALKEYAKCRTVCKVFREVVDGIKVSYEEKIGSVRQKVTNPIGHYLQYLLAMAKSKNRIQKFGCKGYRTGAYDHYDLFHSFACGSLDATKLTALIANVRPNDKEEQEQAFGKWLKDEEKNVFFKYNVAYLFKLLNNLHDPSVLAPNNKFFYSALEAAIYNARCPAALVELLLDCGAPMQNIDGRGGNAIEIALAEKARSKDFYQFFDDVFGSCAAASFDQKIELFKQRMNGTQ